MRMAGVLDEADDTDTFVEVEAARFRGALTEDQYDAIRAAVLGSARRGWIVLSSTARSELCIGSG
jgi:hypothetical protein